LGISSSLKAFAQEELVKKVMFVGVQKVLGVFLFCGCFGFATAATWSFFLVNCKKSLLLSTINCRVMMRMMMRMIELVNCKRACCCLQLQNADDDDATKAVVGMRNAQS
jgi:hypothetical protein